MSILPLAAKAPELGLFCHSNHIQLCPHVRDTSSVANTAEWLVLVLMSAV